MREPRDDHVAFTDFMTPFGYGISKAFMHQLSFIRNGHTKMIAPTKNKLWLSDLDIEWQPHKDDWYLSIDEITKDGTVHAIACPWPKISNVSSMVPDWHDITSDQHIDVIYDENQMENVLAVFRGQHDQAINLLDTLDTFAIRGPINDLDKWIDAYDVSDAALEAAVEQKDRIIKNRTNDTQKTKTQLPPVTKATGSVVYGAKSFRSKEKLSITPIKKILGMTPTCTATTELSGKMVRCQKSANHRKIITTDMHLFKDESHNQHVSWSGNG